MQYESDRGTGPDGDGRLDLKIAGCDLVSGAGHILLRGLTDRLDKIAFTGEGDVRPDAEQCRYRDALEQRPGVEIDLVGEPGISRWIGCWHVVELDRAAVRQDDALPYDQRALLAEGNDAVVTADQPCALRNEKDVARCAVEDAFSDLSGDQAREVGPESRNEARRDNAASGQHVRRRRWAQPMLVDIAASVAGCNKVSLALLGVGIAIRIDGDARRIARYGRGR